MLENHAFTFASLVKMGFAKQPVSKPLAMMR